MTDKSEPKIRCNTWSAHRDRGLCVGCPGHIKCWPVCPTCNGTKEILDQATGPNPQPIICAHYMPKDESAAWSCPNCHWSNPDMGCMVHESEVGGTAWEPGEVLDKENVGALRQLMAILAHHGVTGFQLNWRADWSGGRWSARPMRRVAVLPGGVGATIKQALARMLDKLPGRA